MNNSGTVTIELTAPTLKGRIDKAKHKIDRFLATLDQPPAWHVQALRLVEYRFPRVQYEVVVVSQTNNEQRTIL